MKLLLVSVLNCFTSQAKAHQNIHSALAGVKQRRNYARMSLVIISRRSPVCQKA